jgi:hypothetical protein
VNKISTLEYSSGRLFTSVKTLIGEKDKSHNMIVEKQMECRMAGETEFSEKTCPSSTFVHHINPHDQTWV